MGLTEDFRKDIAFWENMRLLDRVAAIIRDSGSRFDDLLSQVKEHNPHLTHFEQQLVVKKEK